GGEGRGRKGWKGRDRKHDLQRSRNFAPRPPRWRSVLAGPRPAAISRLSRPKSRARSKISIVGDRSFDTVPSEMAAGNGLLDRRALLGAGAAAVTADLVGGPDSALDADQLPTSTCTTRSTYEARRR